VAGAYADDPALDRNFFRHPPHRIARVREALARKAELTIGIQQLRATSAAAAPVGAPAAGARRVLRSRIWRLRWVGAGLHRAAGAPSAYFRTSDRVSRASSGPSWW
jgi:hypothetical protein